MSAPPYMSWYVGDYLADTTHLTTTEHGAYLLLLACMWRSDGYLPADDAKLARFAKLTSAQWQRMRDTIMPFFTMEDGKLTQGRLQKELRKTRRPTKVVDAVEPEGQLPSNETDSNALKTNETDAPHVSGHARLLPEPEPDIGEANASPSGVPPKKSSGKRKPEGPIPDGYPDAVAIASGRELILAAGADLDATRQAERFRNHAQQIDRRCRDWAAAWRNWLAKAVDEAPKKPGVKAVDTAPAKPFPGPPQLRMAVVHAQDEAFARSYLDPCGWQDVPTPSLIPASSFAAKKLTGDVKRVLQQFGVTVAEAA